jgi:hypothetical protein
VPTPDVDVAALIDALDANNVRFLVIGGFAIELHDVPIPPTRDIDITPAADLRNLRRLVGALESLAAKLRVPGGPPEGVALPGGMTAEWLRSMAAIALVTAAGPLDINLIPDGTRGYDDLAQGAVRMSYAGRYLLVAGIDDVIRSKEAAGREKDLMVLPALRAHLRAAAARKRGDIL